MPNEPRPGVTHHLAHTLAVFRVVAVCRTFFAHGLGLSPSASVEPRVRIFQKFAAVAAQAGIALPAAAVERDHMPDRALLIVNPPHAKSIS